MKIVYISRLTGVTKKKIDICICTSIKPDCIIWYSYNFYLKYVINEKAEYELINIILENIALYH